MDILSSFLTGLPATLEQGLIYAVLALGIMITYTILDFPDLTVDGSFPLGGVVTISLLLEGWHPLLALLAAAVAGALAGLATGLIHVKMKVRDLFSGIIVMTALYSINLRIASGSALLNVRGTATTLFRNNPVSNALPKEAANLILLVVIVLALKFLLDWFFTTRSGYLLRAVGDNDRVVTALARDKGNVKIAGLVIANSLVALSGAVFSQHLRMFEVGMGAGTLVLGLASVIIGITLFKRAQKVKQTTAVIIGSLLYKASVSLAIACGLAPGDMKLITAGLFLAILALGRVKGKEKKYAGS